MIKEPWLPVHPDLNKLENDAKKLSSRCIEAMRLRLAPIGWGKAFQNRMVVSEPAMEIIAAHGGTE